jgi:hypothetical protein
MVIRGQSTMRYNPDDMVVIGRHGLKFIDRISCHFRMQAVKRLVLSTKPSLTTFQTNTICSSIRDHCPNLQWLRFMVGGSPQARPAEEPNVLGWIEIDSELTDLIHFKTQRRRNGRRIWTEYTALKEKTDRIKRGFGIFVEHFAPEWQKIDFGVHFWVRQKKVGSKGRREW